MSITLNIKTSNHALFYVSLPHSFLDFINFEELTLVLRYRFKTLLLIKPT